MKHKYAIVKELPSNALTLSVVDIYDSWSEYFDTVHYTVFIKEETKELFLEIMQGDDAWTAKLFLLKIVE